MYTTSVKTFSVWELWKQFEYMYANHNTYFENEFEYNGNNLLRLDFFPIDDTYENKFYNWWVELVEWTDYIINYKQWTIKLLIIPNTWDTLTFKWAYIKCNLDQFITFLNIWRRQLYRYFPIIKKFVYNFTDSISEIDLENLPFNSVKYIYLDETDKHPVDYIVSWNKLIFIWNTDDWWYLSYNTDYWFAYNINDKFDVNIDIDNYNNIVVKNTITKSPIYIYWVMDLVDLEYINGSINNTLNQTFEWNIDAIDWLLTFVAIEMYTWLLHLQTTINISSLKLDYKYITAMLWYLNNELKNFTYGKRKTKWIYIDDKKRTV